MSKQIILYDLPTHHPVRCWSPNVWKTRIVLNYKGLDYKTIWKEYPDVRPLIEKHLPENKSGFIPYTLPTILLPSHEWVMDSRTIAERLELLYPEKPLDLNTPSIELITALTEQVQQAVWYDFVPKVPKRILSEHSVPFWTKTREAWFDGRRLSEVEAQHGGDRAYESARPYVAQLAELLLKNTAGPYFEGDVFTYSDVVWVSFLRFYETLGADVLRKLLGRQAAVHMSLLTACRPFLTRDSY